MVQEGLTNAHKHTPGAPITLDLRYEPDTLVVEVANGPASARGPGVPAAVSGGQGLRGLRERARLVGGMVHTGPTADGGFRMAGMLPYGTGDGEHARPGRRDLRRPGRRLWGTAAGGRGGRGWSGHQPC